MWYHLQKYDIDQKDNEDQNWFRLQPSTVELPDMLPLYVVVIAFLTEWERGQLKINNKGFCTMHAMLCARFPLPLLYKDRGPMIRYWWNSNTTCQSLPFLIVSNSICPIMNLAGRGHWFICRLDVSLLSSQPLLSALFYLLSYNTGHINYWLHLSLTHQLIIWLIFRWYRVTDLLNYFVKNLFKILTNKN